MTKSKQRPFGLQNVPPFRASERYPKNPHKMTNTELNEAWEKDHMKYRGKTDQDYFDHLSRMEYEIRKRT